MGHTFKHVRIHTGALSERVSTDIQARAFTWANHIFLNKGEYSPTTVSGKHLLAHELTHVIQQDNTRSTLLQRKPLPASTPVCSNVSEPTPSIKQFTENAQLNVIRYSIFQKQRLYFRPGMHGSGVQLIHKLLLNTLCSGYNSEKIQRNLNNYTRESAKAVTRFQKTHNDANNRPLSPDGRTGPLTLGSMDMILGISPIPPSLESNEKSNCLRTGKQGTGIIQKESDHSWRIANFDIDESFIKPRHFIALRDSIIPEIKTRLKASNGTQKIRLLGGASTTASLAHNLPLSRRRVLCVYNTLISSGIDKTDISDITSVGDILSEAAINKKILSGSDVSIFDRENPLDRMVLISLSKPVKNKPEKPSEYIFFISCLNDDSLQIVIFNQQKKMYRNFQWLPLRHSNCLFFPEKPITTDAQLFRPLVLAHGLKATARSDFSGHVSIQSLTASQTGRGEFISPGLFQAALPGKWTPDGCNTPLSGKKTQKGILLPTGALRAGTPVLTRRNLCAKNKPEKQTCIPQAMAFEARLQRVSFSLTSIISRITKKIKRKIVKIFGPFFNLIPTPSVRSENGFISIGTKKTLAEKKTTGADAFIRIAYSGVRFEDSGEPPFNLDISQTLEPLKTKSPKNLNNLTWGFSTLKLKGNSNTSTFDVPGLGAFKLASILPLIGCRKGQSDRTSRIFLIPSGNITCREISMWPFTTEETCKPEKDEKCSVEQRLEKALLFSFKVAPLSDKDLFIETGITTSMKRRIYGCQTTLARVNVEGTTIDNEKIWRSFIWIQSTPYCGFRVKKSTLKKLGLAPLAVFNPDSRLDPGVFLSSRLKNGKWNIPLIRPMQMPGDFINCLRTGGNRSEKGSLLPVSTVKCGEAPFPPSSREEPDTCNVKPASINRAFELAKKRARVTPVFSHTGNAVFLNKPLSKLAINETIDEALHAGLSDINEKIVIITKYKVLKKYHSNRLLHVEVDKLSDFCVFNEYGQRTLFISENCKEKTTTPIILTEAIKITEKGLKKTLAVIDRLNRLNLNTNEKNSLASISKKISSNISLFSGRRSVNLLSIINESEIAILKNIANHHGLQRELPF